MVNIYSGHLLAHLHVKFIFEGCGFALPLVLGTKGRQALPAISACFEGSAPWSYGGGRETERERAILLTVLQEIGYLYLVSHDFKNRLPGDDRLSFS